MQNDRPNLFTRGDTMLGVCEALGEDFGFNPLWLRVTFAAFLLWNPLAVIGAYLALGVVVGLSRWMAPNPRPAAADAAPTAEPAPVSVEAEPEIQALAA